DRYRSEDRLPPPPGHPRQDLGARFPPPVLGLTLRTTVAPPAPAPPRPVALPRLAAAVVAPGRRVGPERRAGGARRPPCSRLPRRAFRIGGRGRAGTGAASRRRSS